MKSKRRWLLLIPIFALFAWAWQAASWRPKLVGVLPTQPMNGFGMLPSTFSGPRLLVSPDGKYLAAVAALRTGYVLTLWNPESREQFWRHGNNATRQFPFAFSPDSQTLAVAEGSSDFEKTKITLHLVNAATGKSRALNNSFWQTDLQSAAFLSNRELVAATSQGAIVVDTQTGKAIRQWAFETPKISDDYIEQTIKSRVSADGSTVVVLFSGDGTDTTAIIYDSQTGKRRSLWTGQQILMEPHLSPDGNLWSAHVQATEIVEVHTSKDGKLAWKRGKMNYGVWNWSDNSKTVITTQGITNRTLSVIDARTGRDLRTIARVTPKAPLALDPRGDYFYTLDNAGKIWRWRAR